MEASGNFSLDPRLADEAIRAAGLPLCTILLRGEARFPWLVLVPRRAGAAEPWDLLPGDRTMLWSETERVGAALRAVTGAHKINLALFGNMVRQLHVHVVARTEGDPAWPGSAIGLPREPYPPSGEGGGGAPAFWSALCDALGLDDRPLSDRQSP